MKGGFLLLLQCDGVCRNKAASGNCGGVRFRFTRGGAAYYCDSALTGDALCRRYKGDESEQAKSCFVSVSYLGGE